MDIKLALGIGVGLLLFTTYYLEKQVSREQIFWGFAGAGVAFGLLSVYTVAKRIPSYDYFITFAVLFILIAILYFEEEAPQESESEEVEAKQEEEPKKKGK